MPKTHDETKKGMECCAAHDCNGCGYNCGASTCIDSLLKDISAIIQQLEATVSEKEKVVAELSGKIGQLEVERDAAVNDLHYLVNHPLSAGPCYACLHNQDCWRGGDCDPVNNDRWQWRGVQKD